jgi:hypothetical protein
MGLAAAALLLPAHPHPPHTLHLTRISSTPAGVAIVVAVALDYVLQAHHITSHQIAGLSMWPPLRCSMADDFPPRTTLASPPGCSSIHQYPYRRRVPVFTFSVIKLNRSQIVG